MSGQRHLVRDILPGSYYLADVVEFSDLPPLLPNYTVVKGCYWIQVTTKYAYVYIKSTTVYIPSSELGLSQPLSRQQVCPSPKNREGGGAHSPAGEWLGESQFRRLEKKLRILPTLCR
jgi:hypothetical protein